MKLTRPFRFLAQVIFRRHTIRTRRLHPYRLLDQRDAEKIKSQILAGLRKQRSRGDDSLV
jgi:hypothetical protein